MRIEILPPARDDLEAGFHFYESQQEGIGHYFLDSLYSDIDSLRLYAGVHELELGYHRMRAKRFPYAVYYRVEGDVISIHAVLDCRSDPMKKTRRLSS